MVYSRIKREIWRAIGIFFWFFFVILYTITTIEDYLWLIIIGPIIAVLVYLGLIISLTNKKDDLENIENNPIMKLNRQMLSGLGSIVVFFYIPILFFIYDFNNLYMPIVMIFIFFLIFGIYYVLSANEKIKEKLKKNKRLLKLQRNSIINISYSLILLCFSSILIIIIGLYIFNFQGVWLFLIPIAFPVSFYIEKIEKKLFIAMNSS